MSKFGLHHNYAFCVISVQGGIIIVVFTQAKRNAYIQCQHIIKDIPSNSIHMFANSRSWNTQSFLCNTYSVNSFVIKYYTQLGCNHFAILPIRICRSWMKESVHSSGLTEATCRSWYSPVLSISVQLHKIYIRYRPLNLVWQILV